MAFRARETFFVGDDKRRKMQFVKDAVVPADVAKGREALVYDDGEPAPKRRARKATAED